MRTNNYIISYLLSLSAIISFFIGFSIDEVSMGAGGFDEDFSFVKKSILLFENYSTIESIKYFSETSNRPPLIYILHKHLNPFFTDELGFRKVVFGISLIAPLLFYLCLKEKFNVLESS